MATVTAAYTPTASTANASTYASQSFTPVQGDLLVVFANVSASVVSGGAAGTMTASANGITFTRVTYAQYGLDAHTIYAFVANQLVPASPVAMTVTLNVTGDAGTGCVISTLRVAGMSNTGSTAIRQSAIQQNQTTGTPAPAFGSAALTGNPTMGAVGIEGSGTANIAVPPTGTTERCDVGWTTPTHGLESWSRDSGFTGTTYSWTSVTVSTFGDIILELDSSASTASATVTGAGAVTATLVGQKPATVTITGAGAVTAIASVSSATGTATITGDGAVTANAVIRPATTSVTGAGAVVANSIVQNNNTSNVRSEGRVGGASGDSLMVPLYIYPGTPWDTYLNDTTGIGYLIVNDRSGNLAGQSVDANYATYISNARSKGLKLLFYVDTNYTGVAVGTVQSNMSAWVSLYGAPDGWFFDRSSPLLSNISYYQTLYTTASGAKVVLNHGTTPDEAYLSTAGTCDISVIAENTAATIHAWPIWPTWLNNYSANRYAVLTYSATTLRDTWNAIPPGIKYKFVTDQAGYTANPTYIATERTLASSAAKATIQATATVTGTGAVTATTVIRGTATVTGAGAVTAAASGAQQGVATVTGAGSVTALATQQAGSSAAGVGAVSATVVQRGAATIAGVGSVTASALSIAQGTASVVGVGSVSAFVIQRGQATVTGVGATSSTSILQAIATVLGVGSTVANQAGQGGATVTGVGSVTALATVRAGSSAAGVGSVSNTGIIQRAGSTVSGAGTVVATGVGQAFGTATVSGSGLITAAGTVVILGTAVVQGVGSVNAVGGIKINGTATVIGSGTVTLQRVNIGSPVKKFVPPTYDRLIDRGDSIGRRHLTHGITVLNTGGTFTERTFPSDIECEAADYVYLGGHRYPVSDAEATALTGAGYSVTLEQEWTQV